MGIYFIKIIQIKRTGRFPGINIKIMTYARPLTILAILAVSAGSIYAYNIKTPEERIIESIRIQNQAIEEANSAKIDSYRAILDKCQKTATGTSREILEKLDACKDLQKPELQMIINYS